MGALMDRIDAGEAVVHGGGYLFEMERRGYLQAGAYVPEVVLEHPDALIQLHRDFARAGADVMLAFTYYGHREKLRLIGKEDLLEPMNRQAVRLAKQVAAEFPRTLVAGNICNTNVFDPATPATRDECRGMFEEQVGWAVDEGVDLIVGETFAFLEEARIAASVVEAAGLEFVQGFAVHRSGTLRDFDGSLGEACARMIDAGATVTGVNCHRGPATMLPLVEEIATKIPPARIAAFPVAYRTTLTQPTFGALTDPAMPLPDALPGGLSFPVGLDPFVCTRYEMGDFAAKAHGLGVRYIGGCCGTGPHHLRAMAEAIGQTPAASQYSPDMSKHYALGDDAQLKTHNTDYAGDLTKGTVSQL